MWWCVTRETMYTRYATPLSLSSAVPVSTKYDSLFSRFAGRSSLTSRVVPARPGPESSRRESRVRCRDPRHMNILNSHPIRSFARYRAANADNNGGCARARFVPSRIRRKGRRNATLSHTAPRIVYGKSVQYGIYWYIIPKNVRFITAFFYIRLGCHRSWPFT